MSNTTCIVCGAEMSECGHVCPNCEAIAKIKAISDDQICKNCEYRQVGNHEISCQQYCPAYAIRNIKRKTTNSERKKYYSGREFGRPQNLANNNKWSNLNE